MCMAQELGEEHRGSQRPADQTLTNGKLLCMALVHLIFPFVWERRGGGRGGGLGTPATPLPPSTPFFLFPYFNLPLPFSLSNCHFISLSNLPAAPGEIAQSQRNCPRVKLIVSPLVCRPSSDVGPIKTAASACQPDRACARLG